MTRFPRGDVAIDTDTQSLLIGHPLKYRMRQEPHDSYRDQINTRQPDDTAVSEASSERTICVLRVVPTPSRSRESEPFLYELQILDVGVASRAHAMN